VTGVGEGAPIVRYHENAADAQKAVEAARGVVEAADPWRLETALDEAFARLEGQYAARAALDIALHDWVGQRLGIPVYRLLGLDPSRAPVTTFSIGIDTPEVTRQKTREAAGFPVLKVKVGLETDEPTIEAVRSVTDKPLRVDANEGWKDKETAIRKIEWLASRGVELVEQPMPAAMLEEAAWVRERSPIPVFADEACLRASSIPPLAGAYHGVNVKIDKAGGLREALRMVHTARACGLQVMLGCMISSSASTTAAAHLSPLVDFADLDGHLLVSNDPWEGVAVRDGRLVLPDRPGLGLRERKAKAAG
jgi:L-alanine-DL-glutamate epimerase-like enolase superfamily enzyme